MADIREVQQYQRVVDQRNPKGGRNYRHLPPQRPKPNPRTPQEIQDATFVLGVPKREFTSRVHEAMTLLFHEMDSLRWELEVCHQHEVHILDLADQHSHLPVMNRRAFYRELGRAERHVAGTSDPSTLLVLGAKNLEGFRISHGIAAHDALMSGIAQRLVASEQEVGPIGYLGSATFGVIHNVADQAETSKIAELLAAQLTNHSIDWEGQSFGAAVGWGTAEIKAGQSPADIHHAADADLRSRLRG